MNKITGYIGTYVSAKSEGIYHFIFDPYTCEFENTSLFYPVQDAKYISLYKHTLVAPCKEERAGVCSIDETSKASSKQFMEDATACYVTQDDHFVYTANYHEGSIMVYTMEQGTLKFHHKIMIASKGGCHQVIPYGKYILVPCLLLDKIVIFDTTAQFAYVKDITFTSGTGPRHGIFNKDQSVFYLVSELSNEVFIYDVQGENFTLKKTIALPIPKGKKAASAAIRLSKDEKYIYISIRDVNLICVFDTKTQEVIQSIDCGGDHPRDMDISPDGNFVFVVNRFSNNVAVYKRNIQTGKIEDKLAETQVYEGVSIVFCEGGI